MIHEVYSGLKVIHMSDNAMTLENIQYIRLNKMLRFPINEITKELIVN